MMTTLWNLVKKCATAGAIYGATHGLAQGYVDTIADGKKKGERGLLLEMKGVGYGVLRAAGFVPVFAVLFAPLCIPHAALTTAVQLGYINKTTKNRVAKMLVENEETTSTTTPSADASTTSQSS